MTSKLKELPIDRVLILKSEICVYCGNLLGDNGTEDHVVGRNFVPKGTLKGHWNLKILSCKACNGRKSGLEDDISAITIRDAYEFSGEDPDLAAVYEKKGRSVSRKTKKHVSKSEERFNISLSPISGLLFNFKMSAPPQIDESRAFELAFYHMRAIYFVLTYDDIKKCGKWWIGQFQGVDSSRKSDWGNSLQRSFCENTKNWDAQWHGITAKGFFKSVIKKNPSALCWSWALEWNESQRVIGFFGEPGCMKESLNKLEKLKVSKDFSTTGQEFFTRLDEPLSEELDTLFTYKG